MSRISREQMFMDICDVIAKRSTCMRNNVGAILVNQHNNIISIGYNGPPPRAPHCSGKDCPRSASGGCRDALHAEHNAIVHAPDYYRHDVLTLYTSFSPCHNCAVMIKNIKAIRRVFYRTEYRDKTGIQMLIDSDIQVYRLTTAGHLIDASTNNLIPQT